MQQDQLADPLNRGGLYGFAGANPQYYWDPYGKSGFGSWVSGVASSAGSAIADVGAAAMNATQNVAAGFVDAGVNLVGGAAQLVYDAIDDPVGTGKAVLEGAGNAAKNGYNAGKRFVNDPAGTIERVVTSAAKVIVNATYEDIAYGLGQAAFGVLSSATGGRAVSAAAGAARNGRRAAAAGGGRTAGGSPRGTGYCFAAGTLVLTAVGLQPIEEIRVGQRVVSDVSADYVNAEDLQDPECRPGLDASPSQEYSGRWLKAEVELWNPKDSRKYQIVLLRPAAWFEQNYSASTQTVALSFEELNIFGVGKVLSLSPCNIEPGSEGVVTATFQHLNENRVNLEFSSQGQLSERVRTTKRHPFFSVDRNSWVAAESLQEGEQVATHQGIAVVEAVQTIRGSEQVYNLEIQGNHTYYVGSLGVLVHNVGCGETSRSEPPIAAQKQAGHISGTPSSQTREDNIRFLR